MRRTLRTAAAAITATVVLLPTAARADVLVRYDPGHDVRALRVSDFEMFDAPGRVVGDIVRTRIVHEGANLRVSVQFRALPATGYGQRHEFILYTPTGERDVLIDAGPGNWRGKAVFTYGGPKQLCPQMTHQIDYTNARVIIVVPRVCLGNPPFVKVGAKTRIETPHFWYLDDAQANGGPLESFELSPGVYR